MKKISINIKSKNFDKKTKKKIIFMLRKDINNREATISRLVEQRNRKRDEENDRNIKSKQL